MSAHVLLRVLPSPPHARPTSRVTAPARNGAGTPAAVRARLAPVCAGWPPDRFAALVADVVRFHARWDA